MAKVINRLIQINADLPADAEYQDVAEFIMDALESWGGQRHPEDPLFSSLSVKAVKIGQVVYKNSKGA